MNGGIFRATRFSRTWKLRRFSRRAKLVIVETAEQLDFAGGPAAGGDIKLDTPLLAHGRHFLDGAAEVPGQHGVGLPTELFQLGRFPGLVSLRFHGRVAR